MPAEAGMTEICALPIRKQPDSSEEIEQLSVA